MIIGALILVAAPVLAQTPQPDTGDAIVRRARDVALVAVAVETRARSPRDASEVLDTLVLGGATSIAGVKFDLKDRAGAEREALRLAVADARTRADRARVALTAAMR